MRIVVNPLLGMLLVAAPLFAGALALDIGNPAANPEAQSKHAVLVARTTACRSPEKTQVTATAEGFVNGQRRTLALTVIPLSAPGTFAITRAWPSTGTWAVKIVARNPDYKNYATGALVAFEGSSADWTSVKHYFHDPTDGELAAVLDSVPVRTALH